MGHTNRPAKERKNVVLRLRFRRLRPLATVRALLTGLKSLVMRVVTARLRWRLVMVAVLLVLADVFGLLNPFFKETAYALGDTARLLPESSQVIADRIQFDEAAQTYTLESKSPSQSSDNPTFGESSLAGITAHKDPSKGVTVADPSNRVEFTMTPQFDLNSGRKDGDRIVYPLGNGTGFAVYTMRSTGIKEDIVLTKSDSDTQSFAYTLDIGDALEARVEADGSLGVYGNNLLSGEVAASSDKDKQLLEKARSHATKNTLLFSIPAPVVNDLKGVSTEVTASYALDGDTLTVTAKGLRDTTYPIAIDPSIYVTSAQQLMAGNGESNIDFDVDNKLVTQSQLSGGRVDTWASTSELPTALWGSETAISGGYMYSVGGSDGSSQVDTVNWAKLDTGTHTITSANPGDGACDGWCNDPAYDLPDVREKFTLVAYNGYLYAMGGYSPNCTTGNGTGDGGFCDTVYIAKLGANGEPRLWHPTDDDNDNWVYWYRNPTDLPSGRILTEALAYGNHMYLVGGLETGGVVTNTLGKIAINPNGTLDTWSLAANLPSARYDHDAVVYNDRLYLIGGATTAGGGPTNSVHFTNILADGSVSGWQQTSGLPENLRGGAGDYAVAMDGYLYITGGCNAVNGNGNCTSGANATRFVSINADGSLGGWRSTSSSLANPRIGHSLNAWHGALYAIGGCTQQHATNGSCTGIAATSYYGTVAEVGETSVSYTSAASGASTCTGASATNCNLPGSSHIGNLLATTIISGGYLYVIGGCTNNSCTSTSGNTAYMKLTSTGALQRPATCPSGSYQGTGWCVDNAHTISGGVAAASPVVFDDTLYLVGGLNGSGNTGNVVRTSFNADGSIGSWTSQSLSGVGASNVSYTFAASRANPSSADTQPGNLYIFGGCSTSSGANCSAYTGAVYKCNIVTSGAISGCTTSNQLQLGTISGASGAGLALHSGAVSGDYIYLAGGQTPGQSSLDTVRYAKFNNSGNIVTAGSGWTEADAQLASARQRASTYVVNGHLYVAGGYDDAESALASPAIEHISLDPEDGSLDDAWYTSDSTVDARWGVSVATANSYAYFIGGCSAGAPPSSCSTRSDTLQAAAVHHNTGGTPFDYTAAANSYGTDPHRFGAGVAVYDGRIYVAGGCGGTAACTSTTNSVTYASIGHDGAIGSWTDASADLPAARGFGKLLVGGNSLYFVGGQTSGGSAQANVYYATPASDGNVSSWSATTSDLPNARSNFGATVWNNRIYIVGGQGASGDCTDGVCNTVYVSPDLSLGGDVTGSWSTSSPDFDVARSGAMAVANGNALYVMGGYDGANYLSDVQYAAIDEATGDTASWSDSTSLPRPIAQGDGFSANGYLYVVGGRSADSICKPSTLIAPIGGTSESGTPSGVGSWYEAPATYSGDRFGNAAIYHEGKLYAIGGADCRGTISEFTSAGTDTYTVPSGVTSVIVKAWGGGGGSGGGGSFGGSSGDGGGGGYTTSTLSVTPGEDLSVRVGGGGGGGNISGTGGGGGGGGYSGLFRSSTPLLIAGGGGGGGGSRASTTHGGDGGSGGCGESVTEACDGKTSVTNAGGTGGSDSTGGYQGVGNCNGGAGSSLTGGGGANKSYFSCSTGGNAGGTNGGGAGGTGRSGFPGDNSGGGGGGGGYYGGGGGSGGGNESSGAGGGGGGGSSYATGTAATTTAGNGTTPGNASDADRGSAGQGKAGVTSATGVAGNAGKVMVFDGILAHPSPVITQAALQAQPQIAKYSILFDMEADVFPNHWLLNGSDGSDGTRWQITYRSMTNPEALVQCGDTAMTTWGDTTMFADANLATPSLLSAQDGDGDDTSCTRYFTFEIVMDSTRSASFPSLPSSNPAISEIVLSMVVNPAKRLRHGRTFVGGLQTPIDTPYYGY